MSRIYHTMPAPAQKSSPEPSDPPRRHSTRKATQPTRLKPSTPSVAKTPARTNAVSDTRRRKLPGARDGHDDAPSDQAGVAPWRSLSIPPGVVWRETTSLSGIWTSRGWPWDDLCGISFQNNFLPLGRLPGRKRGTWPTGDISDHHRRGGTLRRYYSPDKDSAQASRTRRGVQLTP